MNFNSAPLKRLIGQVDDTCEYVIGLIRELHEEAQNMRRNGMEDEKILKLYQEAAALYKQLFPISGRCKFLYQDPKTLELLLYLEEMNGDRKYNKHQPPYFNKPRYPKKNNDAQQ
jgi:hypothetical protein